MGRVRRSRPWVSFIAAVAVLGIALNATP